MESPYQKYTKLDEAEYERVNDLLRDRVYITAREWAIARLCADFRTETGVPMTDIGDRLPDLVPFMEDTYSPQSVNQARVAFEDKVRLSAATFFYGAYCGFFTPEELDDILYEATEIAKFLLEVEGSEIPHRDESEVETDIQSLMSEIREASVQARYDECPNCGENIDG